MAHKLSEYAHQRGKLNIKMSKRSKSKLKLDNIQFIKHK